MNCENHCPLGYKIEHSKTSPLVIVKKTLIVPKREILTVKNSKDIIVMEGEKLCMIKKM